MAISSNENQSSCWDDESYSSPTLFRDVLISVEIRLKAAHCNRAVLYSPDNIDSKRTWSFKNNPIPILLSRSLLNAFESYRRSSFWPGKSENALRKRGPDELKLKEFEKNNKIYFDV